MSDLEQWWSALKPETRRRLQEDPYGPVPPELLSDVMQGEPRVSGGYWVESQPGAEGYHLHADASEFIEMQSGESTDE